MERFEAIPSAGYAQAMNETVLPYLRRHVRVSREENGLYCEFYPLDEFRGTVLLSHGFTENCAKFAEIIYYLHRAGYQVAAMDHRGHGRSPRDPSLKRLVHADRFDDYVEDMQRVVSRLVLPNAQDKPTCLIGHSMGGAIALLYLQAHPETFTRAVLTAPMVQVQSAPLRFDRAVRLVDVLCRRGMSRRRAFITRDYSPREPFSRSACSGEARFDWYKSLCAGEERFQQSAATYGWVKEAFSVTPRILNREAAAQLTMPLLFLAAGQDTLVRNDAIERLCILAPDARLVRFPESRHEIYRGEDATVARWMQTVLSFLKSDPTDE